MPLGLFPSIKKLVILGKSPVVPNGNLQRVFQANTTKWLLSVSTLSGSTGQYEVIQWVQSITVQSRRLQLKFKNDG